VRSEYERTQCSLRFTVRDSELTPSVTHMNAHSAFQCTVGCDASDLYHRTLQQCVAVCCSVLQCVAVCRLRCLGSQPTPWLLEYELTLQRMRQSACCAWKRVTSTCMNELFHDSHISRLEMSHVTYTYHICKWVMVHIREYICTYMWNASFIYVTWLVRHGFFV